MSLQGNQSEEHVTYPEQSRLQCHKKEAENSGTIGYISKLIDKILERHESRAGIPRGEIWLSIIERMEQNIYGIFIVFTGNSGDQRLINDLMLISSDEIWFSKS